MITWHPYVYHEVRTTLFLQPLEKLVVLIDAYSESRWLEVEHPVVLPDRRLGVAEGGRNFLQSLIV